MMALKLSEPRDLSCDFFLSLPNLRKHYKGLILNLHETEAGKLMLVLIIRKNLIFSNEL